MRALRIEDAVGIARDGEVDKGMLEVKPIDTEPPESGEAKPR